MSLKLNIRQFVHVAVMNNCENCGNTYDLNGALICELGQCEVRLEYCCDNYKE